MFNNNLKVRFWFFSLSTLAITAAGLVIFVKSNDLYVKSFIAGVCTLLLWLFFRLAIFTGVSDNRVRIAVLSGSTVVLLSVLHVESIFAPFYKPVLGQLLLWLKIPVPESLLDSNGFDFLPAVTIAAWLLIVWLVIRRMGGGAMGAPELSLADILPHVTNRQRIDILKRTLRAKLDQLDEATRWNVSNYVPLEAEVQILDGRNTPRKIIDLLKAIREKVDTRLFVILGEPGTGKSVALRKLARDLLDESGSSDRIPVYINLKEWRTGEWDINNKPTVQDFHKFVYYNLLQSLDFTSQSFLSAEVYRSLLEAGYLFFILDSFDEIPAVLDHDENSWIIAELSECISTYLLSGHNSRGLISSRLFRQPKIVREERSVFEIQPFSDDRIVQAIQHAANNPRNLIRAVLTERNDLGSIARNPFLLHLIIHHFNQTGKVPRSQAEMFETFIESNILLAKQSFGLSGIDEREIYKICEDISATMFDKASSGLEIGEAELRVEVNIPLLPAALRFLTQARLGRVAAVSGAFSFSHRRFNEYFLVRRLQSKRTNIPFDAIQNDSRWRDALVLYAEIAERGDAVALAAHAWHFASQMGQLSLGGQRRTFLSARHALRFLVEGFRNRPEIIERYRGELKKIIEGKLSSDDADYIEKKTVLEAVGLLSVHSATAIIIVVLENYPGWISEQVASSARYLKSIKPNLARWFFRHVVQRPYFRGFVEAIRQVRLLSVSEAFKGVSISLRWYLFDILKSWIGGIGLLIFLTCSSHSNEPPLSMVIGPASFIFLAALLFLTRDQSIKVASQTNQKSRGLYIDYSDIPRIFAVVLCSVILLPILEANFHGARRAAEIVTSVLEELELSPIPQIDFERLPQEIDKSTSWIMIACLVIVIPLRPTFWSARWIRAAYLLSRDPEKVLEALGVTIGVILVIGVIVGSLTFGVYLLAQLPVGFGVFAFGGFFLFMGLWWFVDMLRLARYRLSDWMLFWRARKAFQPDRADIARHFLSMRTGWGRLKYVIWLETASADELELLRRDSNVWPDGKRPQLLRDEASIRLAQLDAKWLELE